jgi:DNA-directed RNA polymerase specialized sigma24 family protein
MDIPPMQHGVNPPEAGSPAWLVAVYPRLLGHLKRPRVSRPWAEDAAQHAVAQALPRGEALRHHPNPFGWLLATARHYAIDRARQRRAWDPLPPGEIEGRPRGRGALVEAVWEALRGLTGGERKILEWHYFEGLTDRQVGIILFEEGSPQARGQRARKCRLAAERRLHRLLVRIGLDPDTEEAGDEPALLLLISAQVGPGDEGGRRPDAMGGRVPGPSAGQDIRIIGEK